MSGTRPDLHIRRIRWDWWLGDILPWRGCTLTFDEEGMSQFGPSRWYAPRWWNWLRGARP